MYISKNLQKKSALQDTLKLLNDFILFRNKNSEFIKKNLDAKELYTYCLTWDVKAKCADFSIPAPHFFIYGREMHDARLIDVDALFREMSPKLIA